MKKLVCIILALSSTTLTAKPLEFAGTEIIQINATDTGEILEFEVPTFNIPATHLDALKNRLNAFQLHKEAPLTQSGEVPSKFYGGMEGTPVLNQGKHGSCVTFAITGALDALLGAGDYISQLCNLELGETLAREDKQPYGGWRGNYGSLVLQQIQDYGIIPKNYQKLHGCAGVREYPLTDPNDTGNAMSVEEFKEHSLDINRLYTWQTLLFDEGWLVPGPDMNQLLTRVKKELAQGNKIAFGILLDTRLGHAGAMGQHHALNDTWMLTPKIIEDGMQGVISAGHEMVIIGYDDEAVAIDENGLISKGLFTLRNSWSAVAGDNGNYYVTYDYFRFFTEEIHLLKRK